VRIQATGVDMESPSTVAFEPLSPNTKQDLSCAVTCALGARGVAGDKGGIPTSA
jgi:hypothetical protein